LGDSSFSAQFMVKNVVCFSDIFTKKGSEKLKTLSLFCEFEVKNSKRKLKRGEKDLNFSPLVKNV
jgi:hypothetical protein